jgi:hypothetical protein
MGMKALYWLTVTGFLMFFSIACTGQTSSNPDAPESGDDSAVTSGGGDTGPAIITGGGGTVKELYACDPAQTNFADPHAQAVCRVLRHRYPIK